MKLQIAIDGSKKVDSVAKMINDEVSMKMIEDEIDKVQICCTNCHRIRTYERAHELL